MLRGSSFVEGEYHDKNAAVKGEQQNISPSNVENAEDTVLETVLLKYLCALVISPENREKKAGVQDRRRWLKARTQGEVF
jgi:hypothetical protein